MASTFMIKNGDVVFSSASGRPILITGTTKLQQDLTEFFEVNIQPNGFGAGLETLIGALTYGGDALFTSLADKLVRDGAAEFRALQRSNSKITRSADERILGVRSVKVQQDSQDPTKYFFTVGFLTESGKPLTISTQVGG